MKLKSWISWITEMIKPWFYQRLRWHFLAVKGGQNTPACIQLTESYMPLPSVRRAFVCFCWGLFLAIPATAFAQTNYYASEGTQYAIVGSLPGDQVYPDVALNANGGFIVWQDNITDGSGWGISAMQLSPTLSGSGDVFRVNIQGTNNQENARVTLLNNGGAAFVWQGGVEGVNQHIYTRFLWPTNSAGVTDYVWLNPTATSDTMVNTDTNSFQIHPAIATLANGDVVVVWSSYNQINTSTMLDIYGQILSTNGSRIGQNFLINQFTPYNQRSPAVAALKNGGFVVTWVSEQEQSVGVTNPITAYTGDGTIPVGTTNSALTLPSVDIYARLYNFSGTLALPSAGEFIVDTGNFPCADPDVAVALDGSYMITWCAKNTGNSSAGWDIYERSFTNSSGGQVNLVNSYTYGDQYNPRISAIDGDYMISFTSKGQDGSSQGVYGQFIHEGDGLVGNEFLVNTTTLGPQMQEAVASDSVGQFLAVWTSFTFGGNGFDLFAQRYANVGMVLEPMAAPFVWAPFVISNGVYQPELTVSWPSVQGLSVSNYEVFVNGAPTAMATVTGNQWTMTAANGLTAQSTNSFALQYVTTSGFPSPVSPSATGSTWLGYYAGNPPYAIPVEWMSMYFGGNQSQWPAANATLVSGGPTLWQIFNSGGNPTNSTTWLMTAMTRTAQGIYLNWNTQPGMTYQVQTTTDFSTWSNYGAPRFEAGTSDSVFLGNSSPGYYRVQLLRQ
jgi:hypothetical protein